jgi:hemoglobin
MNNDYKHRDFDFIYAIVVELYKDLCDHPEIAQHFIGIDLDRLIRLQTQFITKSIGGEVLYTGRPLKRAHVNLSITKFQYAIVKQRFLDIFKEKGFIPIELKFIEKLLNETEKVVVTSKFNFLDFILRPFYSLINYLEDILRKRGALEE